VLVEKPLAASLSSTERLLGMAAAKGLVLCPVHQFLFQRGLLQIYRKRADLGIIRHVDFVTCSAGATKRVAQAADAVAFEILAHPFALFARMLQGGLEGFAWSVAHPTPGELRVVGQRAGITAGILVSMAGRPTVNFFRVIGERGTAHADLFHGFSVLEPCAVSRTHKVLRPFAVSTRQLAAAGANLAGRMVRREPAYPGLRELVRRFYATVHGDAPNPISTTEILDVARAIERVRA
jgi:predicted dehydrogenase